LSALPSVSIVITAYNQAQFLAEAIESCVSQSVPSSIFLVNDGSTDNTTEIAKQFSSICVITQARKGLSAARNVGLAAASGKFLIFLDADDRLLPDAISRNLLCFESHLDAGLVYGAFRTIDVSGKVLNTLPIQDLGPDPYRTLLSGNRIGMHGTVMYKRDCLLEIGGFDTSLRACEDFDVYLRMARRFPIAHTGGLIAEYRLHSAQMTRDCARILKGALTVLRKHRIRYRADERSYKSAVTTWKRWYASRQAEKFRAALKSRSLSGRTIIETLQFMALAPIALLNALRSPPA
jgi:glycosyltransferase involved in cell wall biosynthesis